jgi:hypothetical protein
VLGRLREQLPNYLASSVRLIRPGIDCSVPGGDVSERQHRDGDVGIITDDGTASVPDPGHVSNADNPDAFAHPVAELLETRSRLWTLRRSNTTGEARGIQFPSRSSRRLHAAIGVASARPERAVGSVRHPQAIERRLGESRDRRLRDGSDAPGNGESPFGTVPTRRRPHPRPGPRRLCITCRDSKPSTGRATSRTSRSSNDRAPGRVTPRRVSRTGSGER